MSSIAHSAKHLYDGGKMKAPSMMSPYLSPTDFGRISTGDGQGINVADFQRKLANFNPQFFDTDFGQQRYSDLADKVGGVSDRLSNIGFGGRDPRFDAFQQAQFNIFESGAAQQRQNMASEMERRGLGNSSVAMNQMGNIDARLAQQKNLLGSQLGMQQLARQDQALNQSLGGYGLQGRTLGQYSAAQDLGLNSVTAGLQNLLALPALEVSALAARNAGKLPPEEEPGLIGGLFDDIFGGLF
jgi:hypothetical protein